MEKVVPNMFLLRQAEENLKALVEFPTLQKQEDIIKWLRAIIKEQVEGESISIDYFE